MVFCAIAIYHVMHLKKVDVSEDGIRISYPLAILRRHRHISTDMIVSYRFSGGHYTESGAVFIMYRRTRRVASIKIPLEPVDWDQANELFSAMHPKSKLATT